MSFKNNRIALILSLFCIINVCCLAHNSHMTDSEALANSHHAFPLQYFTQANISYSQINTIIKAVSYRKNNSEKSNTPSEQKSSLFQKLVQNSEEFNSRIPFSTSTTRIKNIGTTDEKRKQIEEDAQNTCIITTQKLIPLIKDFLTHKKQYGSFAEKELYKNMTEDQFLTRLLTNRPLAFTDAQDNWKLRDLTIGAGDFDNIGTEYENKKITLKDYLSYDEMQIAALIGVATPTFFINEGKRDNRGEPGIPNTYESHGIFIGLVGTRFQKPQKMEWQHMFITPEQNTDENGYGLHKKRECKGNSDCEKIVTHLKMFEKFYQTKFPTYKEAQEDKSGRFLALMIDPVNEHPTYRPPMYSAEDLNKDSKEEKNTAFNHVPSLNSFATGPAPIEPEIKYLDSKVYKERLKSVLLPYLAHANAEGKKAGKKSYCRVSGLGLGVWMIDTVQTKLMLEVYEELVQKNSFNHISDIEFMWFDSNYENVLKKEYGNTNIHFTKGSPADPLHNNSKLLVAMYAWDANSYPGNEYWYGTQYLHHSADPAAACCSTITELQNPQINPYLNGNHVRTY